MKTLLFIPLVGFVCALVSCRTATPLDPHTMKPSNRCLPENISPGAATVAGSK